MITKKQYEEYGKLHKRMWLWLAKNPDKDKDDWPCWEWNSGEILEVLNYCFACKVSREARRGNANFKPCHLRCPIKWGTEMNTYCWGAEALFEKWCGSEDLTERANLAKQIANLWGTGWTPETKE